MVGYQGDCCQYWYGWLVYVYYVQCVIVQMVDEFLYVGDVVFQFEFVFVVGYYVCVYLVGDIYVVVVQQCVYGVVQQCGVVVGQWCYYQYEWLVEYGVELVCFVVVVFEVQQFVEWFVDFFVDNDWYVFVIDVDFVDVLFGFFVIFVDVMEQFVYCCQMIGVWYL